MGLKQVVIVGKPNVGKSQLFNRLTGEKHSIVLSEPGITRDRLSLEVEWGGKRFLLTDTGGYTNDELSFQEEINRQTEIALSYADLVLFVVSCKEGISYEDVYLAKVLKKAKLKNILLVANKCDYSREDVDLEEYKLGLGNALHISAEHGINTGPLLDSIVEKLGIGEWEDEEEDKAWKIAIIGKPNVGKSSLVNALLREERIITSSVPGTTRDAIDLDFEYRGKKYKLIDTPGIRRHSSIYKDEKEKFSILRSKKAISRADMAWLVFDVSDDLMELDERIGGLVHESNIPSLIIVNKCDLIKGDQERRRDFLKAIKSRFKYLSWSPVVFVSAKEGTKLQYIFKKIEDIKREIERRIPGYLLDEFMHKISFLYSVPQVKGQKIVLFSMKQIEGQVPTFLFLCNNPEYLHFSYSRLVENQIRICFGYSISPITVIYKKR